ncbi:hypothetical protein MBEBAB_0029 [Brevundimonas abyssalis TAR-001]|uniref:Uncharacterized protein n=1 Tax=Brevundimonas abyssalis TAR-001 TaxID=1391729 RepID=A0A8E0N7S8_9CAUL|nr:hypothetical protein MBEBAB_0029 [Brevundimonas abyssalis TAR-001]
MDHQDLPRTDFWRADKETARPRVRSRRKFAQGSDANTRVVTRGRLRGRARPSAMQISLPRSRLDWRPSFLPVQT